MEGSRIEGDGLELGVFTQDLAQDLDQNALAKDVVTTLVVRHTLFCSYYIDVLLTIL
jgi:hypothetical protein